MQCDVEDGPCDQASDDGHLEVDDNTDNVSNDADEETIEQDHNHGDVFGSDNNDFEGDGNDFMANEDNFELDDDTMQYKGVQPDFVDADAYGDDMAMYSDEVRHPLIAHDLF